MALEGALRPATQYQVDLIGGPDQVYLAQVLFYFSAVDILKPSLGRPLYLADLWASVALIQ
jgi:hypothetical protein